MSTEAYLRSIDSLTDPHILPTQFFAASGVNTPEKKLMLAILEDALNQAMYHAALVTTQRVKAVSTRRAERIMLLELEWFQAPTTGWLYDFENICDVLDLDVDAWRHRVLTLIASVREGKLKPTYLSHHRTVGDASNKVREFEGML